MLELCTVEVDVEAEGFPLGRRDRVDEKRLRLTLDPVDDEFCCCSPRDLDEGFVAMKGMQLLLLLAEQRSRSQLRKLRAEACETSGARRDVCPPPLIRMSQRSCYASFVL